MAEENQEELKKRLDICNSELSPILEKYEFEIGAQAFTFLDETGSVKVSVKPVLISTKGQQKNTELSKP